MQTNPSADNVLRAMEIIAAGRQMKLGDNFFRLFKQVGKIRNKYNIQTRITDWPFQSFWQNPLEPSHSKLVRFFIDPKEAHGCGSFLLEKLLEVLERAAKASFPKNGWQVVAETRTAGSDQCEGGQIDILISHKDESKKWAIIIENKVNKAPNKTKQLQRYVEIAHNKKFPHDQIFIFYLPRTASQEPDPTDRVAVEKLGVRYVKITFEQHILEWLKTALNDLPADFDKNIATHLNYYRLLIEFLISQESQSKMNNEILKLLEKEEQKGTLPIWSDLEMAQNDVALLQDALKQINRAKLLKQTCEKLKAKGQETWLCMDEKPSEPMESESDFDPRFEKSVNVCLKVKLEVGVCYGGNTGQRWFGYIKLGEVGNRIESVIKAVAERNLTGRIQSNQNWFAWGGRDPLEFHDKNLENSSCQVAQTLIQMADDLQTAINNQKSEP